MKKITIIVTQLLLLAAAVDARKCLEQLDAFGVPMNYIDRGNNSVTPLNIAIKNQSHDVATYLCDRVNDYSPALQFASKSGEQDLNDLSLFLYKHSNSNPGMMVRAVRFNPLKPSDIASGRITFIGEREITIEVDQSFSQVQKGDLITMK